MLRNRFTTISGLPGVCRSFDVRKCKCCTRREHFRENMQTGHELQKILSDTAQTGCAVFDDDPIKMQVTS